MLHTINQAQNVSQRKKSNIPFHRNNWLAQYFIGVVITSSCTLTDTSCLLIKSAFSVKPLPLQIVFDSGSKGILKYDYFLGFFLPRTNLPPSLSPCPASGLIHGLLGCVAVLKRWRRVTDDLSEWVIQSEPRGSAGRERWSDLPERWGLNLGVLI